MPSVGGGAKTTLTDYYLVRIYSVLQVVASKVREEKLQDLFLPGSCFLELLQFLPVKIYQCQYSLQYSVIKKEKKMLAMLRTSFAFYRD